MEQIQEMSEIFKLLGDKTRLTIVALLKEKELCVCDIVEFIGMSQPGISQHLRKLKAGGLVSEKRQGQWIYYSLKIEDKPYLRDLLNYIPSLKEIETKNNCCE
ncbi:MULTISPECIES: metalloregulator ArsR/SmtB family transcription factor [unclassified Paenibacillus]|uniref:ArsR/SmtB family transcription factor n=1 Tax=unclassified Paenibacillus TaxID=185978 RepID=UPI001AE41E9D|nr:MULTISPECIES: metalloregulator ArsR/SmtB family transcription factor [unclassified Paenibacillus]MBP1156483.1 ArsR family transcriptional regulator [Paenibacillus sp. PvP091]MBP1168131.1 ArsR family transcriptional regulator [Paenibacillus sp. PvR098]MBP2439159.1 ArsR family transcriptional regulator [Paenibacillus sp. PvP052]